MIPYSWSCSRRRATMYYKFTPGIINEKQINDRMIRLRCISDPKSWLHIKNTVVLTILTLWYIHHLHLMYAEVAWALVLLGTQVQPQVILDWDYLLDYISVSYDYGSSKRNFLRLYFVLAYSSSRCMIHSQWPSKGQT